jgi:hypothetical protein
MANPPITIGPFDNVPAAGSLVRSDWCQEVSQYVTDVGADEAVSGYVPPGVFDYYNTAMGDWLNGIPQVTKPAWANRAHVITAFSGFFEPEGWGGQELLLRLRYGTLFGGSVRLTGPKFDTRMTVTMIDLLTVTPLSGAQQVAIQAQRPGSGTIRADGGCRVNISWTWRH